MSYARAMKVCMSGRGIVVGWVVLAAMGCSNANGSGSGAGAGGSLASTGGNDSASKTGGAGGIAAGGSGAGGVVTGGSSAGGSVASGGANADQPYTSIRFMQAYLNAGAKKTYDLWAQRNDRSWVSLVKGLAYGQMTDYIQVPIGAGLNTMIWFIPPGSDPKNYAISIGYFIRFGIENTDTGRHTLFMTHVPGESDWGAQLVSDADPTLTPPAGYAYVAFNTDAIRPIYPLLDYGNSGECIDRAEQDNYQPVAVGSHTFSLYSGASASNCQGSLVAATPTTAIGDREVWYLYAIGDATNGFEVRPVKLSRD